MIYLILLLILIATIEKVFEPRLNWNYETGKLMLWYNFKNKRNYLEL